MPTPFGSKDIPEIHVTGDDSGIHFTRDDSEILVHCTCDGTEVKPSKGRTSDDGLWTISLWEHTGCEMNVTVTPRGEPLGGADKFKHSSCASFTMPPTAPSNTEEWKSLAVKVKSCLNPHTAAVYEVFKVAYGADVIDKDDVKELGDELLGERLWKGEKWGEAPFA